MDKKKYLLNFSTEKPDRQKIMIDEVEYEMAVPEDFELEEFMELAGAGQAASALIGASKKNLSPAKIKELTDLLDTVVKQAILELPDEVFAKLRIVQKFAVVNVFSDAVTGKLGEGAASRRLAQEQGPGAKSSPDSTGSTG